MDIKKIIIGFLVFLIIFSIGMRVLCLDKDFSIDELDFVKPALAIVDSGSPVFYHSEQQQVEVGLWHPPMYIFLLSFVFRLGVNEVIARSLNVFFCLFTALVIFLFCVKMIGKEKGKMIGLVSCCLFLFNYFVLSSSIQLDIDILSSFFVFSFIACILLYSRFKERKYFLLGTISLIFAIANRYPITALAYLGVGGYYIFNKELRKDFKEYLLMGISAGLVFLIIWTGYSVFIEPGNFFSFILHNFKFGGEQLSNPKVYIGSFIINIVQFIRLFTFPATLLMILSLFYAFKQKSKMVKVLLIYVLSISLFFLLVPRPAFGYPRYFMSLFPGLFILMGIFLYDIFTQEKIKVNIKNYYLLIGFIVFGLSLILLIILKPGPVIYSGDGLIKATSVADLTYNLLASLPLLVVLFIRKHEDKKLMSVVFLISFMLCYSLYFNTMLVFDNQHIKDVGEYINARTEPDDLILAPKAVAYYAETRFYVNENNKPKLDFSFKHIKKYIVLSFKDPEMKNEFFWENKLYSGFYEPIPDQEDLDKAKYVVLYYKLSDLKEEAKIGNFYVYKNPNYFKHS